jgi:hypothetical protein
VEQWLRAAYVLQQLRTPHEAIVPSRYLLREEQPGAASQQASITPSGGDQNTVLMLAWQKRGKDGFRLFHIVEDQQPPSKSLPFSYASLTRKSSLFLMKISELFQRAERNSVEMSSESHKKIFPHMRMEK